MAETTGISWANATLNFWNGCTKVGTACEAMGLFEGEDQPCMR
jgi:protein gp37